MKLLVIFAGLLSLSFAQGKITQQFALLKNGVSAGSLAMPNEFPYQVGLWVLKLVNDENNELQANVDWCSGTLVHYKLVVTAASCLHTATSATILLGAYDKFSETNNQKSFSVQSTNWVVHSDYTPVDNSADIAVIRLPEVVLFNEAIAPIRVKNSFFDDSNIVGVAATTSGWGSIGNEREAKLQIHFSNLKILSPGICEQVYNLKGKIPLFDAKKNFCVDGSTCPEDVGSPLVVVDNGTPILIGIASYGNKNGCNKAIPTVFTRLSSYLEWFNILASFELSAFP